MIPSNTITDTRTESTQGNTLHWVQNFARSIVLKGFRSLAGGHITILEGGETHSFGQTESETDLRASIRVHHPSLYTRILMGGALGAAESYIKGEWDSDDLTALLRIFVRNIDSMHRLDRGWGWAAKTIRRIGHRLRDNSRSGSRKNIHAHYDLGNDFFSLFLDDTLNYSCAVYETPEQSLLEASVTKMDRACRKLDLKPEDHLLEIGTGWCALAIHAAKNYGCRVTSTTLSQQQYEFAQERVQSEGLSDQIQILLCDYRDLQGEFDKIVSIEMIEAVGHRNLKTYFSKCAELLKPGGVMFIQAIAMGDRVYKRYLASVDFIQKYVFPGSCCPSLEAMLGAIRQSTDFKLFHLEEIGPHYARTLNEWRKSFQHNLERVRQLGYSDEFIRLWNYYLCYCEAGFEERYISNYQMVLSKHGSRLTPLASKF